MNIIYPTATSHCRRPAAVAMLAARGKSPPAFERRCIPPDCVARRSNMPDILAPRALPGGRIGALGATPYFCHGLLVLVLLAATFGTRAEIPDGDGTYDQLVDLFRDLQTWEQAQAADIMPDYGQSAIERRRADLRSMQQRMLQMGVRQWPAARQVDYLTVRAELDQQEFILEVTRPWSRNPAFYVEPLRELAFTELPARGDDLLALQRRLRAIPELLAGARENLTEVASDYADFAIRSLTPCPTAWKTATPIGKAARRRHGAGSKSCIRGLTRSPS